MDTPASLKSEIEALLVQVADRQLNARQHAVDRLWEIGANHERFRKVCLVGIRASATDPWVLVRDNAIMALGEIGNRNDIFRIRQAVRDPEWMVRASAACSLGQRLGKRARKELENIVRTDPCCTVRSLAAVALQDAGLVESIPFLEATLESEAEGLAVAGLTSALIGLGRVEYVDRLPPLVTHEWIAVRQRSAGVVEEEVVPIVKKVGRESIERLVEAIESQSKVERIEWFAKKLAELSGTLRSALD